MRRAILWCATLLCAISAAQFRGAIVSDARPPPDDPQTLCQSSNPLGRCLEFVQDDLEAMGKELEHWRIIHRRRVTELADEEATTEASLVPFNSELAQLDAQLKEKRSQIRHYKAAVVRNDEKIERLLEQVVNARS